jgi:hypothetical protein
VLQYGDRGSKDCSGHPGADGHEVSDANFMARNKVDWYVHVHVHVHMLSYLYVLPLVCTALRETRSHVLIWRDPEMHAIPKVQRRFVQRGEW